jgi:hypothetical protein
VPGRCLLMNERLREGHMQGVSRTVAAREGMDAVATAGTEKELPWNVWTGSECRASHAIAGGLVVAEEGALPPRERSLPWGGRRRWGIPDLGSWSTGLGPSPSFLASPTKACGHPSGCAATVRGWRCRRAGEGETRRCQ